MTSENWLRSRPPGTVLNEKPHLFTLALRLIYLPENSFWIACHGWLKRNKSVVAISGSCSASTSTSWRQLPILSSVVRLNHWNIIHIVVDNIRKTSIGLFLASSVLIYGLYIDNITRWCNHSKRHRVEYSLDVKTAFIKRFLTWWHELLQNGDGRGFLKEHGCVGQSISMWALSNISDIELLDQNSLFCISWKKWLYHFFTVWCEVTQSANIVQQFWPLKLRLYSPTHVLLLGRRYIHATEWLSLERLGISKVFRRTSECISLLGGLNVRVWSILHEQIIITKIVMRGWMLLRRSMTHPKPPIRKGVRLLVEIAGIINKPHGSNRIWLPIALFFLFLFNRVLALAINGDSTHWPCQVWDIIKI